MDSKLLFPANHSHLCRNADCPEGVVQSPGPGYTGRWFITFGHPNFNSRANNFQGYETENKARAAIRQKVK